MAEPSDPGSGIMDVRGLQANERTLLAWVRTGISLIAFGFVVAKLSVWLGQNRPSTSRLLADWVGALFILMGVAGEAIGLLRYVRTRHALLARQPVPVGAPEVVALAIAVSLLGLLLGAYSFL